MEKKSKAFQLNVLTDNWFLLTSLVTKRDDIVVKEWEGMACFSEYYMGYAWPLFIIIIIITSQ